MADLSVPAAAATATGLTIFGVSTGLDPAVLIAGFAGGVWAQSYHPPMHILQRVGLTMIASVIAGYLAPATASVVASLEMARGIFTVATLQLPVAVLVGLMSHKVIGPAIMKFATKKADEVTK